MKNHFTLLLFSFCICTASIAQEEEFLDPTFGNDGVSLLEIEEGETYFTEFLMTEEEKIVVLGGVFLEDYAAMLIYRMNADGTLDISFGSNGYTMIEVATNAYSIGLANSPDGGYIILGGTNGIITLAKVNSTGLVDNSFGQNGLVIMDFDIGFGADVQCKTTGEIVVVGETYIQDDIIIQDFVVLQFTSNGESDSEFGNDGILTLGVETLNEALQNAFILPDNSILLFGKEKANGDSDLVVLKLSGNGEIDESFADDGFWRYTDDERYHNVKDVAVNLAGEIFIITTYVMTDNELEDNTGIHIFKLLPNGILDESFNEDGIVQYNYGSEDVSTTCGDVSASGAIAVAGGTVISQESSYITRLMDEQGNLVNEFGYDGTVSFFSDPTAGKAFYQTTILPDGKILCGGNFIDANGLDSKCVLMKLVPPAANSINSNNTTPSTIFYSSATNELVVDFKENSGDEAEIRIFDGLGRLVYESGSTLQAPIRLSFSQIPIGIYFASLSFNGNISTKSFLKIAP